MNFKVGDKVRFGKDQFTVEMGTGNPIGTIYTVWRISSRFVALKELRDKNYYTYRFVLVGNRFNRNLPSWF